MNDRMRKGCCCLLTLLLTLVLVIPAYGQETLDALAAAQGCTAETLLQSDKLTAGDSVSDWVAIAGSRAGTEGDTSAYRKALERYVTRMYREHTMPWKYPSVRREMRSVASTKTGKAKPGVVPARRRGVQTAVARTRMPTVSRLSRREMGKYSRMRWPKVFLTTSGKSVPRQNVWHRLSIHCPSSQPPRQPSGRSC